MNNPINIGHPKAPRSLKQNVINQLTKEQAMKKRTFIRRISIAAAVVVAVVAIVIPVGLSVNASAQSKQTITSAIDQMAQTNNYIIQFKMRTEPNENFAFIDATADFVQAIFCRSLNSPFYWTIAKEGGRKAVFNGDSVYAWIPGNDLGFSFNKETQAGVLEQFADLLDIKQLLEHELLSLSSDQSSAQIQKTDTQITLIIETEAEGDFKNDYMLNTSISESYNRKVLVFDRQTKFLQGFTVDIIHEGKFVTVLQSEQITYNEPIEWQSELQRPPITWRDASAELKANDLSKLTAAQAVTEVLRALGASDWAKTQNSFYYYDRTKIEAKYFGLKILAVGRAFRSGEYPGQFVPCRVKFKNGGTEDLAIAIRNDNENHAWLIDGGI